MTAPTNGMGTREFFFAKDADFDDVANSEDFDPLEIGRRQRRRVIETAGRAATKHENEGQQCVLARATNQSGFKRGHVHLPRADDHKRS